MVLNSPDPGNFFVYIYIGMKDTLTRTSYAIPEKRIHFPILWSPICKVQLGNSILISNLLAIAESVLCSVQKPSQVSNDVDENWLISKTALTGLRTLLNLNAPVFSRILHLT